ncbi:transcription initiation factor TFIID subunit 8 [Amaranthus tricolor]|uniref:transcription initiation factor TFIID subunit 8 n=1 Tax=Amaranthus tricolor TaxID=29722 RepID=UPI002588BC14|nr:transcription initiation factor TFIID subunit 8 [Amaranthus tricolor]
MSNAEIVNIKIENEEEIMNSGSKQRAHPDDYSRAVAKMAVAQICEGIGFEVIKKSTIEALSEIMVRFIYDLGKSASFHANLAGRSESNVFDIFKGLEDLGCSEIINMSDFVTSIEEVPFSYPIPRFPVPVTSMNGSFPPSFLQMGENPGSKHIPDWLPAFPDPHTYIQSPLWSHKRSDLRIDKGEQARQRRKAERSLLNLQQRLLSTAPTSGSSVNDGEKYVEDNSTLPPKKGNENGGVGERKHVLVKEMFAPAIDALKGDEDDDNGGGSDSDGMEIDKRMIIPVSVPVPIPNKKRPVVFFKMKVAKKMLVEDLDIHIRSMVNGKKGSNIGRDDDKDDKKRRAEFILRQSTIDNTQEVSQM